MPAGQLHKEILRQADYYILEASKSGTWKAEDHWDTTIHHQGKYSKYKGDRCIEQIVCPPA